MNNGRSETTMTGLIVSYSPVTAEKILTPADAALNGVQTNKHRVQLRQHVNVKYPAVRSNALFNTEEFGLGNGQNFEEKRVCWLNVPATTTVEEIQKRLNAMDSPKLVRTLSLKPILSEDQIRTIESGVNPKSEEDYQNDFIIDREGNAVLFRGEKQYRKITFSKSWVEDNDNRAFDFKTAHNDSVQLSASQGAKTPATI